MLSRGKCQKINNFAPTCQQILKIKIVQAVLCVYSINWCEWLPRRREIFYQLSLEMFFQHLLCMVVLSRLLLPLTPLSTTHAHSIQAHLSILTRYMSLNYANSNISEMGAVWPNPFIKYVSYAIQVYLRSAVTFNCSAIIYLCHLMNISYKLIHMDNMPSLSSCLPF